MKILSMPAAAGQTRLTDNFTIPVSSTVTRTLGISPKNGSFLANIKISFAVPTTVSSASFNDCKVTIGGVDYALWGHQTSPTSGSVSYVDFQVSGAIATSDIVSATIRNTSGSIVRTCDIEVLIG